MQKALAILTVGAGVHGKIGWVTTDTIPADLHTDDVYFPLNCKGTTTQISDSLLKFEKSVK